MCFSNYFACVRRRLYLCMNNCICNIIIFDVDSLCLDVDVFGGRLLGDTLGRGGVPEQLSIQCI